MSYCVICDCPTQGDNSKCTRCLEKDQEANRIHDLRQQEAQQATLETIAASLKRLEAAMAQHNPKPRPSLFWRVLGSLWGCK